MPRNKRLEENELKEPLSPSGLQVPPSSSTPPSTSPPPQHANAHFGLMGTVGAGVSIVTYVLDVVSDAALAFALWRQADQEDEYSQHKDEARSWFIITLLIILIPMVIINAFSIIWYWQSKQCLGDYCVLYKMSNAQKAFRLFLHFLLIGPLIRYFDILHYGWEMTRERVEVDLGSNKKIKRRTPKGEVSATMQLVLSRDTALLDMMHSFLQDCPQLVFQIYLLYRSPEIITGQKDNTISTVAFQGLKIIIGLFAISWSLVSYQDELRRTTQDKKPLTYMATFTCLLWRVCMVGSRVLAIGSFSALQVNGEGGLVKVYAENSPKGLVMSFQGITALVLMAHWVVMTIWIYSQHTTFCSDENGKPNALFEFFFNLVMGWVSVFCYVNVKDSPTRRRIIFFYTVNFIENTIFIVIWYLQVIYDPLWWRVLMVLLVEVLFAVGLGCMAGYYAFLHPDRYSLRRRQNYTSWRS